MEDPKLKDTNPKEAIGSDKIPFHVWPETATVLGVLGMLDGALKYGRSNYRAAGVRASVYYDACRRHINKWFEGEEIDPDSGIPHLGHALACLAIIIDADYAGKLQDDRMIKGGYIECVEQMTPLVRQLKDKHANKDPHQYTIADSSYYPPSEQMDPGCNFCGHSFGLFGTSNTLMCTRSKGHAGIHVAHWPDGREAGRTA